MKKNSSYDPKKHHRRSIRLKGYDYGQAGLYFITICCQDRICHFGRVENGIMHLSQYGQIAHDEWLKTPEIRPNVELGAFVIMPNHMHGIVCITYKMEGLPETTEDISVQEDKNGDIVEAPSEKGLSRPPLRGPSQTIGAIVRGYKGSVTKQARVLGLVGKLWQRDYHDRIIWTKRAYNNISRYIINNPAKWGIPKKKRVGVPAKHFIYRKRR